MHVPIVDTTESAESFGADVADLDVREGEHCFLRTNGNDKEVGAIGGT